MKPSSLFSALQKTASLLESSRGSHISCKGVLGFPLISPFLKNRYIIYYDEPSSEIRDSLLLLIESDSVFFDRSFAEDSLKVGGFKGSISSDYNLFRRSFDEKFINNRFVFFPKDLAEKKIFNKTESEVSFNVSKGCSYSAFNNVLEDIGYFETGFVEEPCSFARRGMVVDFFPQSLSKPVRVLFDGGVCSALYLFNRQTQLTEEKLVSFKIVKTSKQKVAVSFNDVCLNLGFERAYSVGGSLLFKSDKKVQRVSFPIKSLPLNDCLQQSSVAHVDLPVMSGLAFRESFFVPAWCKNRSVQPLNSNIYLNFSDLNKGDYLVHEDFGVGEYRGLVSVEGYERLIIQYDGGKINVYPSFFNKISLFKKKGDFAIVDSIAKKGSWGRRLKKAKKQADDVAEDLLSSYAERSKVSCAPFVVDPVLESAFLANFPYKDTTDQSLVWKEIKKDLESPTPMDRLLCGDVGFGKTELSIRAAFLSAVSGGKTLVLAPTTILAKQLHNSFTSRLNDVGVDCQLLTRFVSASLEKKVVDNYVGGLCDVLISTHKAIFKKSILEASSLIVVDDEHKFGVAQKEAAKKVNKSVNMLYMSATPIPRTLKMALSNITNISTLSTPPLLKIETETYVDYFDDKVIKKAVMYEVLRGGQVFFIHNKVKTINSVKSYLKNLLPDINVGVLHGQMSPKDIQKSLELFLLKKIDLLVASSIVESGVDIPSVNTIIINNAHFLGVSQLYQMRGRVGRSSKSSFAYLLIPKKGKLSEESRNRLKIIEKNSSLGSCYSVSLEDLNNRGGGAVFGYRQTGSQTNVGFDLYNSFLEKAISKKSGQSFVKCNISSYRKPYIPENYIPCSKTRVWLYKEVSSVSDLRSFSFLKEKIINLFGIIPDKLVDLIFLKTLELWGSKCYLFKVNIYKGHADLFLDTFFWKNKIDSLINSLIGYKFILVEGGNVVRVDVEEKVLISVFKNIYNGIKK